MYENIQVVGTECSVCGIRIGVATEAKACGSCGVIAHHACLEQHQCEPVSLPSKPTALPSEPIARKWRFVWGPILGVVVAAGSSAWFRGCQRRAFLITEGAAALNCPESEVTLGRTHVGHPRLEGCGRAVVVLQLCSPVEREGCHELVSDTGQ